MENEISYQNAFKQDAAISEVFAASGMFPDVKTMAQALVKILAGKELGISPFESMNSIYIVNGKLALTSKCKSSLIKKSPNYDYKVEKLDEESCTISFIEYDSEGKEKELGKSTFTFKDAAKAGLVNKDNWKNYPKNMLFARALSNGATFYMPHVISGYMTYEEIEDIDVKATTTISLNENGEVKSG